VIILLRHLLAIAALPFVVTVIVPNSGDLPMTARARWRRGIRRANATYIPLFEEPQLRRRIGAAYIEYCNHVPRLVPRLKPWIPGALRPLP